jgi:hypothetical protein
MGGSLKVAEGQSNLKSLEEEGDSILKTVEENELTNLIEP